MCDDPGKLARFDAIIERKFEIVRHLQGRWRAIKAAIVTMLRSRVHLHGFPPICPGVRFQVAAAGGPKTLDRAVLSRGLLKNHHPSKPLLAQETLWTGNQVHIKRTADKMPAAAPLLTNKGDSSTGFTGSLEIGEQRQSHHDIVRRVWNYMETVPHYRMRPRQDVVDNGGITVQLPPRAAESEYL